MSPTPPDEPPWQPTQLLPRPGPGRGNALPTGAHLAEFELLRVIGEGGFGIVYLAHDHSLQRRVAIKEYMPASLAMRNSAQEVVVTADKHLAVFTAGLDSFINEARLLAQFDHPSLLKVYRFWRANGTAYMVMPYYEGSTLKEWLRDTGTAPDERWLCSLLGALTEALAVVHAEHCLHRDIAPDNILLLADSGRPLLLDFGAARQVIGDATQALTAILKPGYAPVEQYADTPSLKQGPWTDIYALCAVVYAAHHGQQAASVGGPHRGRRLRAAGGLGSGPVFATLPAGHRRRAAGAPGRPAAVCAGVSPVARAGRSAVGRRTDGPAVASAGACSSGQRRACGAGACSGATARAAHARHRAPVAPRGCAWASARRCWQWWAAPIGPGSGGSRHLCRPVHPWQRPMQPRPRRLRRCRGRRRQRRQVPRPHRPPWHRPLTRPRLPTGRSTPSSSA